MSLQCSLQPWLRSLRVKMNFHSLVGTSFNLSVFTFPFKIYGGIKSRKPPWGHGPTPQELDRA